MQEAVPAGEGAMAAVLGLPAGTVAAGCSEVTAAGEGIVEPANFNGAGQVVIGGDAPAVARASVLLRERGARRVIRLPVSAPFHTRLMRPAAAGLAPHLDAVAFRDLSVPLWTNTDAAPIRSGSAAREALKRQVASPVRWAETLSGMAAAGASRFCEIGEGRVLAGLVRKAVRGARTVCVSDPAGVERLCAVPA